MPRFMLDTDTCSFIVKRSNEVVLKRLQTVPVNDVFIAAHARCLDLTLVTNNTREFERVRGLAIENWTLSG